MVEQNVTTDLSLVLQFRENLRACRTCDISHHCNGPVPWSGDIGTEFAILGEAPGRTEDKEGRPFVGDSGAILRHWLRQADFIPHEIAYLNSVSCLPSDDGRQRTPTREEMTACRGWMHGQLDILRPKVLITMGKVAYEQLRGPDLRRWPELKHLHGKPMRHPVYGFVVWPTYHPSAYLRGRNKSYEEKITTDLANLRKFWNGWNDGETWPSDCSVCGDTFYNFDPWSIPMCWRHSVRQGILFPEDS